MRCSKIENGAITKYPVFPTDIILAHRKNVSFPAGELPAHIVEELGYAVVTEVAQPAYDAITHRIEDTAVMVGGVPTQQWVIVALDAETIAANQAAAHKTSITNQIAALEASITNRRVREAIRGSGKQWLDGVDDQIAALRAQL